MKDILFFFFFFLYYTSVSIPQLHPLALLTYFDNLMSEYLDGWGKFGEV